MLLPLAMNADESPMICCCQVSPFHKKQAAAERFKHYSWHYSDLSFLCNVSCYYTSIYKEPLHSQIWKNALTITLVSHSKTSGAEWTQKAEVVF